MKYFILCILFLSVGCANKPDATKSLEYSKIDFDIAPGKFEQFELSTWKYGSNACIELKLNKPYNTTEWMAALMFYIKGESAKEMSKVVLYTEQKDSKTLALAFYKSNEEFRIMQNNIKFGETVKLNVTFPNEQTVGINSGSSESSFHLEFKVKKLLFGASSSQATIKILEGLNCNNQI